MQGKGTGPVNRVELESQVLCAALRQSFFGRDKIGSFTSIRELSHLFPDLLPPPEDKEGGADSNKTDYYDVLSIRPQTPANGVIAAYLRRVRNFLRGGRVTEARIEYNKILNAGFILRKPRLRLSHDMVVVRRWLFESQEEAKAHAVVDTQDHIPVMRPAASTATSTAASASTPAPTPTPTPTPTPEPIAQPIQPPPVPAQPIPPVYEPPVQPAEPLPQPVAPQPTYAQQTPQPAELPLAQPQSVEPHVTPQARQPVEEPYVPPRPVEPAPVRPSEPAPMRPQPVEPAVAPVAAQPAVAQAPVAAVPAYEAQRGTTNEVFVEPAKSAQQKTQEPFVFDESSLRKGDVYTGPMPMIVQLLEASQFVGPLEVQALRAQMQLAPDIPVEKLILNAGYVTPQEMNSLKLGEQLLAKGKITMAQFQVAIYDERMSGLRMAESLQVRGWLNVEVRNAIEEFQKKRS